MKLLIACALIAAMPETAMAQTKPDKCQKLDVSEYTFERDKNGTKILYALIRNDDPYTLNFASFSFDLLVGEKFKIGEGSANIQRLIPGDTERVRIFYTELPECEPCKGLNC